MPSLCGNPNPSQQKIACVYNNLRTTGEKKALTHSSIQFFFWFFFWSLFTKCIKILCTRPHYQGWGTDSHACMSYISLSPAHVLWAEEVQFYRKKQVKISTLKPTFYRPSRI